MTCHLNGTGLWDVMWYIDAKDGSACNLDHLGMIEQLETMARFRKP